jgi:MFS family permease
MAFLSSADYVLTYLVPFFGLQGLGFVMSTVSDMLSTKYSYSTAINGLIYSIQTIAYFLAMPLYNSLPKTVDRKVWLSLGLVMNCISILMIAP